MKKLILLIVNSLIFLSPTERTEWYVELYTHKNTTIKVKRSDYLQYKELLDTCHTNKKISAKNAYIRIKYIEYRKWEKSGKFKIRKL